MTFIKIRSTFNSRNVILIIFKQWPLFKFYKNVVRTIKHFFYLNKCHLKIENYLFNKYVFCVGKAVAIFVRKSVRK